jgi:hypothetical protein
MIWTLKILVPKLEPPQNLSIIDIIKFIISHLIKIWAINIPTLIFLGVFETSKIGRIKDLFNSLTLTSKYVGSKDDKIINNLKKMHIIVISLNSFPKCPRVLRMRLIIL